MSDKILSEVSAIMGGRPATEITRDIVGQYWPGSLTWEEIVSRVRSWSDGPITRDEAYEVIHVASLLGVFGHPEGSQFREEKIMYDPTEVYQKAKDLIESLQKVEQEAYVLSEMIARGPGGRENSLAITKIQEAQDWSKRAWEIREKLNQ